MNDSSPLVSIILTSYNYAAYIEKTILSIIGQTYTNWELVIVDDCSADESWEIISSFTDPRIKSFAFPENRGASSAYGFAYQKCNGEYLAVVDSDDWFDISKLALQVKCLQTRIDIDICGTYIYQVDSSGELHDTSIVSDWFNQTKDLNLEESWVWQNYFCHSSLLMRKRVHDEIGMPEVDLTYTPDWSFWLRCFVSRKKFYIIPEKLTYYRVHENNITNKNSFQSFWEYAYTSSKIFHPELLKLNRCDLVLKNIIGFLEHPCFLRLSKNEQSSLAQLLLHETSGSFKDLFSERLNAKEVRTIEGELLNNYCLLLSENKKFQKQVTKLKEANDGLIAESRMIEHRIVKKVRHFFKSYLPPVWVLLMRSFDICLRLSNYPYKKKYFQFRTFFEARKVLNNESWPLEKPLVSVVIPCYNYGRFLNEAIESVLLQTFQDFEIIVVDDGSTDSDTIDVLRALNKPKTRIIRQDNQGISKTRNNGISEAKGKYICCLDADDIILPTYLEKCVFILETKQLDVCYSWVKVFGNESFIWECGTFLIGDLIKVNTVPTTAVFRKSVWDKVGGYSSEMNQGYEDWEFWIRVAKTGAQGHTIREPLMLYRKHGISITTQTDLIHNELCEKIKIIHMDLYSDRKKINGIMKLQYRKESKVHNPHVNLFRKKNNTEKSKINILVAVPWFDLGGSSVLMSAIFSNFPALEFDTVSVATNLNADSGEGLKLYEGFSRACYDIQSFANSELSITFLEYLIRSRDISVLFIVGSTFIYKNLPRLKKKFPYIKVIDQLYNKVGHIPNNRKYAKYIDFNIVANEEVRDLLLELGEDNNRLNVIPHGIDVRLFNPDDPYFLKSASKRPYKEFTIGFIGRLSSEKRPQDILSLASRMPDCKFRIRGEGPMKDYLLDKVKEMDLSKSIFFEERFKNPNEFYSGIDVLVLTSEVEGLPLVLLEAMALRKPVIATKVGRIPILIKDGENGFLYNFGDINELRKIVIQLRQSSIEKIKAVGEKARETILNDYTIEKCSQDYLTLIKSFFC